MCLQYVGSNFAVFKKVNYKNTTYKMKNCKRCVSVALVLTAALQMQGQSIVGTVTDAKTREPLVGAMVTVKGTSQRVITDVDGRFAIEGTDPGRLYALTVSYIGYKPYETDKVSGRTLEAGAGLQVAMRPDEHELGEVSVVAIERKNTETAAVQMVKNSDVIVNSVSAQEIQKTQDGNAGEVIRRAPGVSLIDDKFVMVRGLSQRYNNVWMNGGAVPSSEADSRAFSFDIIPSQQIDNLTIIKTPSAEYPADYTGGFIVVNTKDIPAENHLAVSVGYNLNDAALGSAPTFSHSGTALNSVGGSLLTGGFDNDWTVRQHQVWGDIKLGLDASRRWKLRGGHLLGLIATATFANEYRTYEDMQNNLFGVYDVANDRSNYLRHSVDDQNNINRRLGGMLNLTWLTPSGNHKYELKNMVNYLTNQRYTWREGVSAQANAEHSAEYYYRSRLTYNTQLTGKHTLGGDELLWSVGYAYANRHLPDRRRYLVDDAIESGVMALTTGNDISREWTQLDEHIASVNVGHKIALKWGQWQPTVKWGGYGEYRTREYQAREFIYHWDTGHNSLPSGFRQMDIPTLLSTPDYLGQDGLDVLEQVRWSNNYRGHNTLGAMYVGTTLPFGAFSLLAGVRMEYNDMELISNVRDNERSESSRHYRDTDFFPSLNATYKFTEQHQLRASYGRSINRPEFREVSSSVYYDFDLASSVQGNTELQACRVDNVDLRYEFYPSRGEQVSLAAFYKRFDSPIEWTYTVAGGTDLIYSYKNARSADNFGLELDVRRNLDFIGLRGFSWSFNGALIHSRVKFAPGVREHDRPMQGQSPYLINTGLFYRNEPLGLNVALLYNRIGKRIIGVGRSEGTTGGADNESARIPDSYEMPRNVIDLSATKKLGSKWDLKLSIRDLLAERVLYKQFADVVYANGTSRQVEEMVRSYKPGCNIGVSVVFRP